MYDPECETLAEYFLREQPYTKATGPAYEARVKSLAQTIQDAIEEWFFDQAERPPQQAMAKEK
jgi:hypothetical protein